MTIDFSDLDLNIARTRVFLSLVAMLSIYIDPSAGEPLHLAGPLLATLTLHLTFSLLVYLWMRRGIAAGLRFVAFVSVLDVLFATGVAVLTEGPTSPAHVFFAFAIIAVGCRAGFRTTLLLTAYGVVLYLPLVWLSSPAERLAFSMRPVYLAITGYLFSFLGQQRLDFETRLGLIQTTAQRHAIARSLHDGYVQALASVNLRLKTCRALLARGDSASALREIQELESGVGREYDDVRAYVRSLADHPEPATKPQPRPDLRTRVHVIADFTAEDAIAEHVLQILLEGMRNARRHGQAATATLEARSPGNRVEIRIDDDGIGFGDSLKPPWSIASRVEHTGGQFTIARDERRGAHIEIELPTTA